MEKSPNFILTNDKTFLIRALNSAKKYIKIVTFQFTSEYLSKVIEAKAKEKVNVEIITLPPDSYKKKNERDKIEERFRKLRRLGVKIYECIWEVGDASLTTTSLSGDLSAGGGQKWYSLHGKFIVTENEAIILSLNFTDSKEIEVFLFLHDKASIEEFNTKFNELQRLFVEKSKIFDVPGRIIESFDNNLSKNILQYYRTVNRINVEEYPKSLIVYDNKIPGLKICPFDGRARTFLYNIIDDAEKFCYIISERFFDEDLVTKIREKLSNSKIDFRLITNPPKKVRQAPAKAKNLFLELVSIGVNVKTREDVHAKMWLTENTLVISSVNLSKMNLGFEKRKGMWRANTETLYITNNPDIINIAKVEFEKLFDDKLSESFFESTITTTNLRKIKSIFNNFGKNIDLSARKVLNKVELRFQIESRQIMNRIIHYSIKLAELEKRNTVQLNDVVMASILIVLSRKRSTLSEISEFFMSVIDYQQLKEAANKLEEIGIIHKNNMYYELELNFLFNKVKEPSKEHY